ncbi:AmmeMemoRadiSam system protein B [Patescibacteria group bacterium]|nr:AmmeMemoRadiSam system protein B [Patescibacteria group bacterium]
MKKKYLKISFWFLLIIVICLLWLSWQVKKNQQLYSLLPIEQAQVKIIRSPAVAGTFYPSSPSVLKNTINQFLDKVQIIETDNQIMGLILPHAGYQYSGQVASYGIKQLAGQSIDTIILIGNSHYDRFDGISVYEQGYYKTPLGEVKIDSVLASKIINANKRIFFRTKAHEQEHGLEVELPLLQQVLDNFKIVPIMFGNGSDDDYKILAEAIVKHTANKNVLLIASSDLSHYPSRNHARIADLKTIDSILTGEVDQFKNTILKLKQEGIPNASTFACGQDAIKTVMQALKQMNANEIKLFNYANSGDVIETEQKVVGYTSIGFFGARRGDLLNKLEKEKLLQIAKQTITSHVLNKKIPEFEINSGKLKENLGAFVTIRKQGRLRGCIGRFSPTTVPLHQVVSEMAISASSNDSRFPPVQPNELAELDYEVSVLSNLIKIDDWQEIELGKHGVQIRQGMRSGVFLPQVATDNNWDINRFMGELCSQKAGLAYDCWKNNNVEIYVFTAQVFE